MHSKKNPKKNKAKSQQKHFHQIQILKDKSVILGRESSKCFNLETNGSTVFFR